MLWRDLSPAVPRHWLFAIAGFIWTAVGGLLCLRAIAWLDSFPLATDIFVEMAGVVLAIIGYLYMFSKAVQKSINRIHGLPDRVCAFGFTAWKGYLMIGIMVTVGVMLRSSSIPKYYLSAPYTAMGGMLMIGGVGLFRQFVVISYKEK